MMAVMWNYFKGSLRNSGPMDKVLVVDDDAPILSMVSDALENKYEVFTAESVADAENIIKDHEINLLIADLVMPEKNGIDMIMEFRKAYPKMKIMAISGGGGLSGRFDYLPIAKLIGARITLKKPFTLTELRNSADELLQKDTEK